MTTRRTFLKGAVAGAAALVAGVKLRWPEAEQTIEKQPPQPVKPIHYPADEFRPADQIVGNGYSGGIEVSGQKYNGIYSLTFTSEQTEGWFLEADPIRSLDVPMKAELGLTLWGGKDMNVIWMVPGSIVPVKLDCGIRCVGVVNSINYSVEGDGSYLIADVEMTCHNVRYEILDSS